MAYKNKTIRNPITGQEIRFIQTSKDTNGQLLEMESTYNAMSKEPVSHYHPHQDEFFTIVSGEMTVRLDGEETHTLQAGDTLEIPRNQIHAMWNATNQKAVINWQVRPALNTEQLLETVMGLASNGKCNKKGMPGILQVALTSGKFSKELKLVSPPLLVQTVVFSVLRPFALMAGYKAEYQEYLD
ncbi:MAG: cupin domain-containing protein [Bacteroidetes bacterium]|nr:cupin domain-containing protein [Bacteroidota bacterium]